MKHRWDFIQSGVNRNQIKIKGHTIFVSNVKVGSVIDLEYKQFNITPPLESDHGTPTTPPLESDQGSPTNPPLESDHGPPTVTDNSQSI